MNGKQRVLQALRRGMPDQVPVFEWFVDATIGRAVTGGDDPLALVEQLDLDGYNVRPDYQRQFRDASRFVDEWGIERCLTDDILPAVTRGAIPDIQRHRDYPFPDPAAAHRFASFEQAQQRFGDERAVVVNLRDGFSDLRDLLGYDAALMAMLLEPGHFADLLQRSVEYNLRLAEVAKERCGAQIVVTTDDVAHAKGMLMRPEIYLSLIGPKFREIMAGFKSLGYLCIKHSDGNVDAVVDFWIDAGIDCLDPIDPGGGYTMAGMKARYGDKICLKGNIDCTGALCEGTPEQVAEEVRRCIVDGGEGGGLIVSSSNTIHHGVRAENFRAMVEAVRRYGRYPQLG